MLSKEFKLKDFTIIKYTLNNEKLNREEKIDYFIKLRFAKKNLKDIYKNFPQSEWKKPGVIRATKDILDNFIRANRYKINIENSLKKYTYKYKFLALPKKKVIKLPLQESYLSSSCLMALFKSAKKERNRFIRETRAARKYIHITIHKYNVGGLNHKIKAIDVHGVKDKNYRTSLTHINAGDFLEIQSKITLGSVTMEKKPKVGSKNCIGIELEFFSDSNTDDLTSILDTEGLGKYACLKGDGSIRPDDDMYGHELAILVDESNYKEVVKKITKLLKDDNAQVNKSCGFHVHLDARGMLEEKTSNKTKLDLMFNNLVASQNILYKMNPKSREENTYCKRTRGKVFSKHRNTGKRYKGINACSYNKFQTIEVRIHSGTVDSTKIINWIDLLLHIKNSTKELKATKNTVTSFCKFFEIKNIELINYIQNRINYFTPQNNNVNLEQAS